jgi:hypothetical protein
MPLATVVVPTVIVPAEAEMVQVPPSAQFWPLTVVELFTSTVFGTVPAPATVPLNVGEARVRPETVEAVPPNDTAVEPIVTLELASTVFGTVPAPATVPLNVGEARVRPETVEAVPPNDTAVEPIVTLELASELLPMLDSVFDDPEMVLFVNVSVVARATSVSVAAGIVRTLDPKAPVVGWSVIEPDVALLKAIVPTTEPATPKLGVAVLPNVPALL